MKLTIKELCEIYSNENVLKDKFISPLQSMKHLAAEVTELTHALSRSLTTTSDEIADVIICTVLIANKCEIDLEAAIRRKTEINRKRGWLK